MPKFMKDAKFKIQRAKKMRDRLKENEQRVISQNTKDKLWLKQLHTDITKKGMKISLFWHFINN